MVELNQAEKELIITSLGNSIADHEQSDIHSYCADLYEKLRLGWLADPAGYYTAKEIIDIRDG